jgi:hypothetical protein
MDKTIATQFVERFAKTSDEGERDDLWEEVYEKNVNHYRLTNDFGSTLREFEDASILDAENITAYKTLDDLRRAIAEGNDDDADPNPMTRVLFDRDQRLTLEGDLDLHEFYVDLLQFENITRNGEEFNYYWSTDRDEIESNDGAVVYTTELLNAIGHRVQIECEMSTVREERTSSRGNPYYVDIYVLVKPRLIKIVEVNNMSKCTVNDCRQDANAHDHLLAAEDPDFVEMQQRHADNVRMLQLIASFDSRPRRANETLH